MKYWSGDIEYMTAGCLIICLFSGEPFPKKVRLDNRAICVKSEVTKCTNGKALTELFSECNAVAIAATNLPVASLAFCAQMDSTPWRCSGLA